MQSLSWPGALAYRGFRRLALALLLSSVLGVLSIKTGQSAAHVALYVNAATFAFAAVQVYRIREIPTREQVSGHLEAPPTVVASVREGLRFAHTSPLVRGLLVGMLGALAATGAVVGNGKLFTETILDGGEAAFALLFGSVFVGIAVGVALGPRALRGISRRRAFGPAITGAGLSLCFMSVVPVLALVVFSVLLLGFFAGIAY